MDRGEVGSNFSAWSGEDGDEVLLKNALKFFDADFFNEDKVKQMAKGALEFNVPAFQKNRKLVASVNGGLHDPSVLVFNPSWDTGKACREHQRFNYTPICGIQRPEDEEDIAFMTVKFDIMHDVCGCPGKLYTNHSIQVNENDHDKTIWNKELILKLTPHLIKYPT